MIARLQGDGRRPLQDALERAWDSVAALDIESLRKDLGDGDARPDDTIRVSLLGDPMIVNTADRTMRYDRDDAADVSRYIQVLVLHYLAGVGRTPLTNRFLSFKELEGGALYYPAFKARSITPLVKEFGYQPELFRRVAASMGAEELNIGSLGFRFKFFDKLPVSVILWLGDLEVSASANMLFDASASQMLPTEDLTVVGGVLSRTLIKKSRE